MAPTSQEMVSIIIPVFNEEENVFPLYEKLISVLRPLTQPYEVIFVDDGSTDNTLKQLKSLCEQDPTVKVISFLHPLTTSYPSSIF